MPYHPHTNKKSKHPVLSAAVLITTIVGPAITIPQVYQIFAYQNSQGVSVITWTTAIFTSMIWLSYGIIHKEKPISIAS